MFKLNKESPQIESFLFVFLTSNLFVIFAFLVLPIILLFFQLKIDSNLKSNSGNNLL
jgi:hypothetical protein